tara:strand:+ start:1746 stop:3938 length:2193 start_codon:yes stop_codon:yes gene_type:complete
MSIFSSLLGIGEEQPRLAPTGTVVTEQSLAEEISPFYKDLLEKSQAFLTSELEKGYQPYTGQTIADRDPRELQAIQGIESLVGTQAPYFDQAKGLLDIQADKFTPEAAKEYMNPYQQAVTDIAKREAIDDFDLIRQKFEKQATGAGGMSGLGTRAAVQTGLLGETLAQNLSDIQMKGSAAAFEDARKSFELQKARERGLAAALPTFATGRFGAETRELGGLQAIGEDERARQQLSLDEAYKDFLEEERFEPQQLDRYQAVVQGFPNINTQVVSKQGPVPNQAQRFLSSAGGLGALYGSFGGFTPQGFGSSSIFDPRPRTGGASGGQVRRLAGGGLAGLPMVRAQQGTADALIGERSTLGQILSAPSDIISSILPDIPGDDIRDKTSYILQYLGDLAKNPEDQRTTEQPEASYVNIESDPLAADLYGLGRAMEEQRINREEQLKKYLDKDKERIAMGDAGIEVGSGGVSPDMLIRNPDPLEPLSAEALTATRKKAKLDLTEEALQDMLKSSRAKTEAEKKALTQARQTKVEREAKRDEVESNRYLVNMLSRFSKNILDTDAGGATIGSAFSKSVLEEDPARQKELERADTVADKIAELDAAIMTAQEKGDLNTAKALLEQRNTMDKLATDRAKVRATLSKNRLDNFFKSNELRVKQTKAYAEILDKIVKSGIENDETAVRTAIKLLFDQSGQTISGGVLDNLVSGALEITSTSARNPGSIKLDRNLTAAGQ